MAAVAAFLRRHLLWCSAAGLLLLGAAAFLWWRARAQRPQYVTAAVSRGKIQRSVSATGALNPVVTVQVGSYVSGTVKSLACDYNTEVVVGQVCATIDPLPFQLIVDQDEAQVGISLAQLKKDRAALVYAKLAFERDSKLLAENTVSQDAVDNDRNVYDQAQALVGLDLATIVDKDAVLKAARVNLSYTNIVSPVVGTVITRVIDVGQTVAASLTSPTLFLIGKDLTHMQVDTNVSEADIGEVRVGQDSFFTVQAFPGKTFRGKVTQIRRGPITVQNVVTYDVVVAVPNPDRSLFPGMTADVHIVIDEHDDVLRVQLPAVRFTPEGFARSHGAPAHERGVEGKAEGRTEVRGVHRSRVWVLSDGALRAIQVSTGLDDGALIEVSGEGLAPGDQVVVNEAGAGDQRRSGQPQGPGPGQNQFLRQPGGGPRL
jgi:HlyD family secretion protein